MDSEWLFQPYTKVYLKYLKPLNGITDFTTNPTMFYELIEFYEYILKKITLIFVTPLFGN